MVCFTPITCQPQRLESCDQRHFFDPVHGSVLKGCIYYFKIAVPRIVRTCRDSHVLLWEPEPVFFGLFFGGDVF